MNLELYKILQILADAEFHSGEELAQHCNTTRAAISKRVAKINKYLQSNTFGFITIQAVVGKGYCLNNRFDYLSCLEIENRLHQAQDLRKTPVIPAEEPGSSEVDPGSTRFALDRDDNSQITSVSPEAVLGNFSKTKINFIPLIDSTSDFLSDKNYTIPLDEYHVCIAEQQLKGRGRNTIGRQKRWYSPFGNNIYCSIAWQYPGNKNALIGLSLIAGITVAELLFDNGCTNIMLKWPNDILVSNRKIAGILTECYGDASGCCRIVIGFGINIHNNYNEMSKKIITKNIIKLWTNLVSEYGLLNGTRNMMIADLITRFLMNYNLFLENGLSPFLQKWSLYDYLINKMINIDIAGNIVHGRYLGIDQQGALLAEINGETKAFYSGEISVAAAGL